MKRWYIILAATALLTSCHSSRRSATTAREPQSYTQPSPRPSTSKPSTTDPTVAAEIIAEARRWLGTPYRYGGIGRDGTDCSGMVMTIYQQVGHIALPRNSARQQEACLPVDVDRIAPADLVFFSSKRSDGNVSHVGIYIGGKEFIHASSSRGVMVSRLDEPYYIAHYHSAGRVPALATRATEVEPIQSSEQTTEVDSIREAVRAAMSF